MQLTTIMAAKPPGGSPPEAPNPPVMDSGGDGGAGGEGGDGGARGGGLQPYSLETLGWRAELLGTYAAACGQGLSMFEEANCGQICFFR